MEFGNFGAILRFALQLEVQAAAFYETTAQGEYREPLHRLMQDTSKRQKRLERARREGVVEMLLEPITGFDSDDYRVELDPGSDKATNLRQAIALEKVFIRFYRDGAVKLPIPGIARLFQRLARENESRKEELEGLLGS